MMRAKRSALSYGKPFHDFSIKQNGEISQRKFLRISTTGLTGLLLGLGAQARNPSLQDLQKVKQGIEDIVYECSPILPIPKRGCYTGTNLQSNVSLSAMGT